MHFEEENENDLLLIAVANVYYGALLLCQAPCVALAFDPHGNPMKRLLLLSAF